MKLGSRVAYEEEFKRGLLAWWQPMSTVSYLGVRAYLGIFVYSLLFTINPLVSWIFSLSVTMGIILFIGIYALQKKEE